MTESPPTRARWPLLDVLADRGTDRRGLLLAQRSAVLEAAGWLAGSTSSSTATWPPGSTARQAGAGDLPVRGWHSACPTERPWSSRTHSPVSPPAGPASSDWSSASTAGSGRTVDRARRRPGVDRPGRAGDLTAPAADAPIRSTTRSTATASRSTRGGFTEADYSHDDLGSTETLFAVGNGYLGLRGNVEEGRETHTHGTFINGFHETWPIRHAEEAFGFARTGQTIVNVPDDKTMKLYVDDEPMLLASPTSTTTSAPWTSGTACCGGSSSGGLPGGKRVKVSSSRMVSFTQRHLAIMTLEVTMLDDHAPVVISSQILNRQDGKDEYHVRCRGHGRRRRPAQGGGVRAARAAAPGALVQGRTASSSATAAPTRG